MTTLNSARSAVASRPPGSPEPGTMDRSTGGWVITTRGSGRARAPGRAAGAAGGEAAAAAR